MHEVLVNRLGGLSLPRKSVVRLFDRLDITLDVYRGRKTTKQEQRVLCKLFDQRGIEVREKRPVNSLSVRNWLFFSTTMEGSIFKILVDALGKAGMKYRVLRKFEGITVSIIPSAVTTILKMFRFQKLFNIKVSTLLQLSQSY